MSIFHETRPDGSRGDLKYGVAWAVATTFTLVTLTVVAIAMPQYNLWRKELRGQADLREAEWNRQIQVQEAEANLESERLNAQAEVERAKGAAEAIEIEGGNLTEKYIQYLWVRQNQFNDKTTIYIPTETNLPILEANRL